MRDFSLNSLSSISKFGIFFFMFAKFLIDSLILYVLDALPLEKQSILISLQSEAIKKRSLMEKKALES